MVRAWHPDLIPVLDDNRIVAAHAEIHYMLTSLSRGHGIWFKHPETQRFYGRSAVLRTMHGMVVDEMTLRGYNHLTPEDGQRAPLTDLPQLDCFGDPFDWLQQDMADLYRKWMLEGRWKCGCSVEQGSMLMRIEGGKPVPCGLFREPRSPKPQLVDRQAFELAAARFPAREWTTKHRHRLAELITAEGRLVNPEVGTTEEPMAPTRVGDSALGPVVCPFPTCEVAGTASGVKNHYMKKHGRGEEFQQAFGHRAGPTKQQRLERQLTKQRTESEG